MGVYEATKSPELTEVLCAEIARAHRELRVLNALVEQASRAQDAKSEELRRANNMREASEARYTDARQERDTSIKDGANMAIELNKLREENARLKAEISEAHRKSRPARVAGVVYQLANLPAKRVVCEAVGCKRLTVAAYLVAVSVGAGQVHTRAARLCPECRTHPGIKLKMDRIRQSEGPGR